MIGLPVIWIGDRHGDEFARIATELERQAEVIYFRSPETAVEWAARSLAQPALVLIAQRLPGEFAPEQATPLWRAWPLVRIVRVLGTWCEGELRTGRPWPGMTRLYWHQALPRLTAELRLLAAGRCPRWGLPLTTTEEDRLAPTSTGTKSSRDALVAIRSHSGETAEALADACSLHGYSAVWIAPRGGAYLAGVKACLFNAAHCEGQELDAIETWTKTRPDAPLVALLDFPRNEDVSRAAQAGAEAVLAKPFLIDDLMFLLDRAVSRRQAFAAASRRIA